MHSDQHAADPAHPLSIPPCLARSSRTAPQAARSTPRPRRHRPVIFPPIATIYRLDKWGSPDSPAWGEIDLITQAADFLGKLTWSGSWTTMMLLWGQAGDLTDTLKYLCSGDMGLGLAREYETGNTGGVWYPTSAQLAKLKPSASAKAACAKLIK